ncbi:MAG: CAP domain-containing protein [Deltaproteobacteria bacterium]|nr:CAP domain-containing protein [Deltaproteobacteria bacterium]
MDSSRSGAFSANELILTINLAGKSGVRLRFYHKEFGDEDHSLPNSFQGSTPGDGVAVSADGTTWYKVKGLTSADGIGSAWKLFEVNLDAAAAAAGIAYNETFKIKFQQYDNYPIPTDGFAFDEIAVESADNGGGGNLLPQETELIALINQQRLQNNLPPLRQSDALCAAARRHSVDMAQNDFLSHTGSDGSSPWDRMRQAGYQLSAGGENVGAGFPTATDMVNGWMNSPGHRANILGSFCDLGVGYATGSSYGAYWTLDLGCQ